MNRPPMRRSKVEGVEGGRRGGVEDGASECAECAGGKVGNAEPQSERARHGAVSSSPMSSYVFSTTSGSSAPVRWLRSGKNRIRAIRCPRGSP
jgi:hypothetical protein